MENFFICSGLKVASLLACWETSQHLEPTGTRPAFGGSCGGVASDTKQG